MAKVRYTGLSGIRAFTEADFESVGVEDQGDVKFAGPNLYDHRAHKLTPNAGGVDVSDAAARHLVENEGHMVDGFLVTEFELIEEEQPEEPDAFDFDDDDDEPDTRVGFTN